MSADPPQWARDLDDQLGRVFGSKPARVLGWVLVAGWCAFLAWHLIPLALA